jgi:uncharacterized protein
MLRLIILGILAYLLYRVVKGVFSPSTKIERGRGGGVIDEMVQDPYCKTYIPRRESVKRVIQGEEYLFCSDDCADKFESERKG